MHGTVLDARQQLITNHQQQQQQQQPSSETTTTLHIEIPYRHRFISGEADEPLPWWNSRFPTGYSPCNVLVSERIPPMPFEIRETLIDRYCPETLWQEIKASDVNRDCIVRAYLGRRRVGTGRPPRLKAFSLRNYPLHVDQMEEMGIGFEDLVVYAHIMAEALAMMHWYAEVDGNDVEFVLAPVPSSREVKGISNVLGTHVMWLLDFDCCKGMSKD
ncbi:hypothetical protein AJ79_06867 [Helicocarpus griseus UAMH5409]|uniref:DUF3669 domain-containing protein n=1 Tax=Helicocarpus griseus UAMH5409 TaxID=1447875 RepID=A0A2B7X898_9EURO|nr:hypothetical protein AJ79_06867 [Helicocarpus griseus UAMH5409]